MTKILLTLKILKAGYGDSLLLRFGEKKPYSNILIDGGLGITYKKLRNELKYIENNKEAIDLLIITHIDDDHIYGIKKLFQNNLLHKDNVREIWFNSGLNLGIKEKVEIPRYDIDKGVINATFIEDEIISNELEWIRDPIKSGFKKEINDCILKIISPDSNSLENLKDHWTTEKYKNRNKASFSDHQNSIETLLKNQYQKDPSIPNQSSIALIFEYKQKRILLLADSTPVIVIKSLKNENGNHYDLVKISHHGSKHNTNIELLKLIESNFFIISTNGSLYRHPDKECLSKIVNYYSEKKTIAYNYNSVLNEKIFTKKEIQKYKIEEISIQDKIIHIYNDTKIL